MQKRTIVTKRTENTNQMDKMINDEPRKEYKQLVGIVGVSGLLRDSLTVSFLILSIWLTL